MTEGANGQADPVAAFHAKFEWRRALREERGRARMSQVELANRAGLSPAAVRAYESGARHPTVEALDAMIAVLGLTPDRATPIRAGAGYAVDLRFLMYGKYEPRGDDALAAEVVRYPWPVGVFSQVGDVLAQNDAFWAMMGPELSAIIRRDADARNMMGLISNAKFADRCETWDEAAAFIVGLAKGDPRQEANLERPQRSAQEVMRIFLQGDPRYITRVLELWQKSPAIQHWTRHQYRFHWRAEDGTLMKFWAVHHVADIWSELFWVDYIPQDGETWDALRRGMSAG